MDITTAVISTLAFGFFLKCQAEFQHVLVCENGFQHISCKIGYVIRIIDIKQKFDKEETCEAKEKNNCISDFSQIRQKCDGHRICGISGSNLRKSICLFQPRYVRVIYSCYHWFYVSHRGEFGFCLPRNIHINCPSQYYINRIALKTPKRSRDCNHRRNKGKTCIKDWEDRLNTRCRNEHSCPSLEHIGPGCSYFPFAVKISYECVKASLSNVTNRHLARPTVYWTIAETTESSKDFLPLLSNFTDIVNEVKHDSENITIVFDEENRLLAINPETNQTFSLCSALWSNSEASVTCKHLNLSDRGISGNAPRSRNYGRLNFSIECLGNETSLYECAPVSRKTIHDACKTSGDATVQCFGRFKDDLITVELQIGIIIGCLVFLSVAVILVSRYRGAIKIQLNENDREGSVVFTPSATHNQSYAHTDFERENDQVIMDVSSRTSEHNNQSSSYFLLDPKETGYNRTLNQTSYLTRNQEKQPLANQTGNEDQYSSSVEGVYDVTNDNRHVMKDDGNVYSHTVDDVYDVTNANRQISKNETNIYSHTVDDVYDVSIHNRKQDDGNDSNYQEFSVH